MSAMSGQDRDNGEADARSCLKLCKKFIAAIKEHPDAKPFRQPVDPVKDHAPDYFQVIKEPMDLKTITDRLNSGHYLTPYEVDLDVRLMVKNCLTYNASVPLYCDKARALEAQWQRLFWENDAVPLAWGKAESALYQVVPEETLYWQPPEPHAAALQERHIEAAGAELLRAAAWLQPQLTISCGGRTARLLGGHHASPAAVWTACECADCGGRPLSPAEGGRMMTLQELHDHCTSAAPDAPALSTQELLKSFHVSGPPDAVAAAKGANLLEYLRARSEALGGAALVAQEVWVYWCGAPAWPPPDPPQGGAWRPARVVCFDGISGEYLLRYLNPQGPKARWLPCFRAYLPITFHHAGAQPPSGTQPPTLLQPIAAHK